MSLTENIGATSLVEENMNEKDKDAQTSSGHHNDELSPSTYFTTGNEENGIVEVDLVSYREKGKETRYLAFNVYGNEVSSDGVTGNPTNVIVTINSREQFEELKGFFMRLDWND